jgi:hypothetical protein
MKHIKVLGFLATMLAPAGAVYAGFHSAAEVVITLDMTTGAATAAQGNEADAYNSVDGNQYIGCGGSSTFGWCQVNSAFCTTSDPTLIAHIRSVAADSFVRFTIDLDTGDCVGLSVSHNSFYRPKAP